MYRHRSVALCPIMGKQRVSVWDRMTKTPDRRARDAGQLPPLEPRVGPAVPEDSPPAPSWAQPAAVLLALAGAAIALFTSVSLLSGMDQVILGAVLACVGAGIACACKLRPFVIAVCLVLAGLAVWTAVSDEQQLDQRRQEIQNVFNTP